MFDTAEFELSLLLNGKVINKLENLILTGKLPHAIIIAGNSSSVLTMTAYQIAAKLLLSRQSLVQGVTHLLSGNNLDFLHLAAGAGSQANNKGAQQQSSNQRGNGGTSGVISINQIRDVIEFVSLSQFSGGIAGTSRVVVINPIDKLTTPACQCMLKILEEPPAGVIFLLASLRPGQLPSAVRSRCQIWQLDSLTLPVFTRWLETKQIQSNKEELQLAWWLAKPNYNLAITLLQFDQFFNFFDSVTHSLSNDGNSQLVANLIETHENLLRQLPESYHPELDNAGLENWLNIMLYRLLAAACQQLSGCNFDVPTRATRWLENLAQFLSGFPMIHRAVVVDNIWQHLQNATRDRYDLPWLDNLLDLLSLRGPNSRLMLANYYPN